MNKIKNLPEKIYLNLGDGCLDDTDFHALSEVTWSEDKATDNDVEYIRKSEWISVDERLPDEHEEVLTYTINAIDENTVAYYDGEDWYNTYGEHIRPHYWLPIPQLNHEKQK